MSRPHTSPRALTPSQRVLRARIAALAAHARYGGAHMTAASHKSFLASFERGHGCQLCPRIDLPAGLSHVERERQARRLLRLHMTRLAYRRSRAGS